ncbi:MAG TPA: flagellar basal body rod protein FlgB [Planctomycetes bacterium]|nr:flagellar basal body rod protein FlgB [Planctomycetota bacterium]
MAGQEVNILNCLEAGLKAESSRQKAIANNIANMNTPGFRRSDIRFEELLARTIDSGDPVEASELEAEFYQPKTTRIKGNGNDVSLDTEVGSMVKNTLLYKTYTLLLKKKYRQIESAIRVQG